MSKRSAVDSRPLRKRKKAGASYASISIDGPNGRAVKVEDIRVWNVSTSEATGRVSATRRTHKHLYESLPVPSCEEPPGVKSIADLADPEPSEPPPAEPVAKRKRVRAAKENDSVSSTPTHSIKQNNHTLVDEDGRLAPLLSDRVGRVASQGRLGGLECPRNLCNLYEADWRIQV